MSVNKKVQHLIVDTSAFIRNAPLQDIGTNIVTEQNVVDEITSKRQLRRLVVLPYDLNVKHADPDDVKFVTEFAKKTGDYCSLSATDIKVIALTYKFEKENVGTEHLRLTPTIAKTVDSSIKQSEDLNRPLAGFYIPQKKIINVDEAADEHVNQQINEHLLLKSKSKSEASLKNDEDTVEVQKQESNQCFTESDNSESDYDSALSDIENDSPHNLSDRFSKLTCEASEFVVKDENETEHNVNDILVSVSTGDSNKRNGLHTSNSSEASEICHEIESKEEDEEELEDQDDNESNWITPSNINMVKKEIDSEMLEEKLVTVACLTMDFAMQNVLMQIGLNVASLDGRVIKQMRTFILRCHACFKTTSIMTKVFCPNCGNKTLKKVAISLDEEGKQQIHINFRRPLSKKGKRFPLPMPRGGKHANNPILVEDQPLPDQRPTRLARTKNDPLQEDYIAGYSPFIMRDVNSKSAMLGIRPGGAVKYWMKKNPNENRRKRK